MSFGFTCIQDSMANKQDYVELGLNCADICKALSRGMNGKKLSDLSHSACEAINGLTRWVEPAIRGIGSSLVMILTAGLWQRSETGS